MLVVAIDIYWILFGLYVYPECYCQLIVGMGLTLSGIVMQAVVQNPLADPYILGITSGASLGVLR